MKTEQEPVAWRSKESKWRLKQGGNSKGAVPVHKNKTTISKIPLYTAPPKRTWVGLTREEAKEICLANRPYVVDMVIALDAELKKRNGFTDEENT